MEVVSRTEEGMAMESRREDVIDSALAAVAFFQNNVSQADTKIGFLCAAQAGFAMALVNGEGVSEGHPITSALSLLACAFAFLASGYHLVLALRPRTLFRGGGRMVIGFPRPNSERPLTADEVWRMAEVFSTISRAKNQHIRRCIPWLAFMLVLVVANGLAGRLTP
ncbi:hypothetical protein ABZ234_02560 [Nocardiopsis sp. NPDC006198]|jgi:hypothetical protein|uniref:hypothetical protein n=2 Tax=Nocardiopsis TaxID=2013 RepID=UPI002E8622FA|nr:hypothetical protein [Nocardiopsis tropica]